MQRSGPARHRRQQIDSRAGYRDPWAPEKQPDCVSQDDHAPPAYSPASREKGTSLCQGGMFGRVTMLRDVCLQVIVRGSGPAAPRVAGAARGAHRLKAGRE